MNEMTSGSSSMATAINSAAESRLDAIDDYFNRIQHLFDVRVCLGDGVDGMRDFFSLPDTRTPPSPSPLLGAGVPQVHLASNEDNLERAKKYWESVQLFYTPSRTVKVCQTSAAFQRVSTLRDVIERSCCAVLKLDDVLRTLEIGGREECVAAAVAMVDEAISEDEFVQCHRVGTTAGWGFADSTSSVRTKLESEDSSYDSDYENSEPLAAREHYGKHEEASRTVSDTLGAEFAEYVGILNPNFSKLQLGDPEISEEDVFSDPEYTSRIEFALKLGYTEKQAQIALQKLGSRPQQNELLAELIKLGACIQLKSSVDVKGNLELSPGVVGGSRKLENYSGDGYELRSIVIDGSNVAMSHGNKDVYSCRGIKLCVDWFKARGHRDITVFVPRWRKEASRPDAITKDQEVLWELEKERRLVFTPSRQMGGRRMACHDDRYILKLAVEMDGVVVSNDNYRDLINESPEFKKVIEERLLMFSFVNDRFMPPDDPLGRHGPSLDNFLCIQKKSQEVLPRACPYGKKCTYGNKCKYYHPERGNQPHKSVSEQLAEQAKIHIQEVKTRNTKNADSTEGGSRLKATLSSPFPNTCATSDKPRAKMPLQRTKSLLPQSIEPSLLRDVQPSLVQPKVTITPPPPDVDQVDARNSPTIWSPQFYGDGGGSHLSVAKRLSDPDNCKGFQVAEGGANMHRKLQRQLTLNPVYDPRLVHMKRYIQQQEERHLPLVRHSSEGAAEAASARGQWGVTRENLHMNVTRIASAPDSFHQWQPLHSPEIHPQYVWGVMLPHPNGSNLPASVPCAQMPTPGLSNHMNVSMSFSDKRNHLYYHLSSLFPKEQVRVAMDAHPEETDPQAICVAILNTFPPHR